jgi:DNA-binding response OmpR family regulator
MAKVLYIEDDLGLATDICELLEESGNYVHTTDNIDTSRTYVQNETYDVVISDWDLGYGQPNGGEIVTELREYNPNAKFVVFSGLKRDVPEFAKFISKMDILELMNYVNEV